MQAETRLRSAHSTGLAHAKYALYRGGRLLYEHGKHCGLAREYESAWGVSVG